MPLAIAGQYECRQLTYVGIKLPEQWIALPAVYVTRIVAVNNLLLKD
jgi:hypothetical protein